jgi:phage gpG-like protein
MISFEVSITENASGALRKAADRLSNLRPLLEGYGQKLARNFRRYIDDSRMPNGKAFPPLKRPRGKGHNPNPKPLIDTGSLRGDIQYEIQDPDTVRAGNTLEYAVYHNKGTRHLPLRTYIGLSESDAAELKQDAQDFLVRAFQVGPA